ncbi:MAG: DUF2848 domain-containing protein [Thermovirga sp.]
MNVLYFNIDGDLGNVLEFKIRNVINAGYAGRDQASVQAHIDELKEKGVPAPEETPTYFPVFPQCVLQQESHDVLHETDNTGEAEYVLLFKGEEIFVAAGNDHTDRKLEEVDIAKAKQVYPNFISREVWNLSDVIDHWDSLEIQGWIMKDGKKVLFQNGKLSSLMGPKELMKRIRQVVKLPTLDGLMVFSGTIASLFNIDYSPFFEVVLHDPIKGRTIKQATTFNPVSNWFLKEI